MVRGYSPFIGQLTADFVEYYQGVQREWKAKQYAGSPNPADELKIFAYERKISKQDVVAIAKRLEDTGWDIDTKEFIQGVGQIKFDDVLSSYGKESVFDRYLNAIKQKRWDDAHEIFEAMTPSEQQVIRDREAGTTNKIKKVIGVNRETAVIDKLNKIAKLARDAGWSDIVERIEKVAQTGASMLQEVYERAMREIKEMEDMYGDFSNAPPYVIQKYQELVKYKEKLEQRIGREAVDEAKSLIQPVMRPEGKLDEFRAAMIGENWEEAKRLYTELSPEEQQAAQEIATDLFKVSNTTISLRRVGQDLFNKGRYSEAANIDKIVRALLPMAPEGQEFVLLIIDPAMMEGLPQAFQAQGPVPDDKLQDLKERAMPSMTQTPQVEVPCPCPDEGPMHDGRGAGVGVCDQRQGLELMPIAQLIGIADKLDKKGMTSEANAIDAWIKRAYEEEEIKRLIEVGRPSEPPPRQPVSKTKCEQCGKVVLYRGEGAPKYCRECLKDVWGAKTAAHKDKLPGGLADERSIDSFDPHALEEGVDIELEHTNDEDLAREIAMDHLTEHPERYYEALKEMEERLEKERKGKKEAAKKKKKSKSKSKKKDHGGKPKKVVEIADAIRRDNPDTSDEAAYRMAWETYCSYTNPGHSGCTQKGKSKRKSPKPYEKSSSVKIAESETEKYLDRLYQKLGDLEARAGDFEYNDPRRSELDQQIGEVLREINTTEELLKHRGKLDKLSSIKKAEVNFQNEKIKRALKEFTRDWDKYEDAFERFLYYEDLNISLEQQKAIEDILLDYVPDEEEYGVREASSTTCPNCGRNVPKSEIRGKVCRKCANEMQRPESIPGK